MKKNPVLAFTIGDCNGIGPELILKVLQSPGELNFTPVIFTTSNILSFYANLLGLDASLEELQDPSKLERDPDSSKIYYLEPSNLPDEISTSHSTPGIISANAGLLAMRSVETALDACQAGWADAMITAPISKEAVNRAGYAIPGHTEFLAEKTGTSHFAMMLASGGLRVVPVTIHNPIKDVARLLTQEKLETQIEVVNRSLQHDFGIGSPKIAVLGLNPHAGDGGVIGNEEEIVIGPAIHSQQNSGIRVEGPFPADGFFGTRSYGRYDAVLSMYHDQGLVPFKALTFNKGVNFTAGLPIIRTSPDHGTAFSIAGQNRAETGSFREAVRLAEKLARNRIEKRKASYE